MKHGLVVLFAGLLATACMVGEVTHRIYIDPDGSVTWVVHEHELRSTSAGAERGAEEADFLAATRLGLHPVARAFELLVPESLDSQVLRAERPFEVRTGARFHSVVDLAVDLLDSLGLTGTVRMWRENEVTHFEVVVDPTGEGHDLEDDTILELADELSRYRLLMTEGRFVSAVGFEVLEDGAVAVPVECEVDGGTPLVLSLSWTAG